MESRISGMAKNYGITVADVLSAIGYYEKLMQAKFGIKQKESKYLLAFNALKQFKLAVKNKKHTKLTKQQLHNLVDVIKELRDDNASSMSELKENARIALEIDDLIEAVMKE